MKSKKSLLRHFGIAVLTSSLLACSSAEQSKAKYSQQGKEYLAAGDYDKAALAFKNVQQIDPKDWDNHFQIAEVLSKQGKIEPAFKEYVLVTTQDDNHVLAKLRVGQIQLLSHNIAEAEKMVDSALLKEPENIEALVLKAGVLAAKNNTDAAISTIEKALKISPEDVPAILMQASIQVRINKIEQGINILKNALEKKPDNVQMLSMLGSFYTRNKQLPEAEQTLVTIIKTNPKEPQSYKNLALFQIGQNELDKAEATLRDAVEKLPDNNNVKSMLLDFLSEKRSPDVAIAEILPMIEKKSDDYVLKFKLVNLQLVKKDISGAETTLKEIVEEDKTGPSAISAKNKLASIYTQTKRIPEAKTLNKEVLEANPRDSDALTLRGQFALSENQLPQAIADFRSVLVDQPNNTNVLKMLATAHLRNNEESLARENIEKVVAATPNDESARLDLVGLYMKAGQKAQAKQQIESLLKNNPKSIKGLESLFRFYSSEKQWDKAQDVAKQVQDIFVKDPTGYYMSGLGYQAANKLDAAIEAFQQALQRKPDAVEPLNEMIKSYMALNQPEKAITKLQQIVKQQKDHLVAYNLLGGIYLNQKKFSEAKTAFQNALEIKPDWFAPYRSLAINEILQNNKPGAEAVLRTGIEKTKGNLDLVVDLARFYQSQGQLDKVLALYEDSLKNHPDSPIAANNLASYLSDYAPTPDNLERAAKLVQPLEGSNNPNLLDTIAWIAYKQGNYEKAKSTLQKVTELTTIAPINQYHLGMIYYKLNDKEKAIEYLQKAVDRKNQFDGIDDAKDTLTKIKSAT